STNAGSDLGSNDSTETAADNSQESVVPVTGGQATSHDGVFSIVFSPLTFDQLVTVTIEKLEDLPASETRSVFGAYRVSLSPDTVTLAETKTVRAQFAMTQEGVDAIGITDMRVVVRTDAEAGFATQQEPRFLEGQIWSTSSIVTADFGLIRTTEPNTCECNEDSSCTESCDCDPDCGDNPDPSESGNPTNCGDGEFSCHSGDQCIPQIYFCDGLPQCNDGSDETDNACDGTAGPADDAFEPDNTYNSAGTITLGESQVHTLPAGDGDFVKFTIETRQEVLVTAVSNFERPALTLYTENHSQIASTSDGFFESGQNLNEVLDAGTYFVYAFSAEGSAITSYSLKVQASDPLLPGPQNLTVSYSGGAAVMAWTALEGASSYNVYYGEMPGGPYEPLIYIATEGMPPLNTEATTFSLNGFPSDYPIYAMVRGVDENGVETYASNEVNIQVPLASDMFEPDNSFSTASALSTEPIYSGTYRQAHSSHVIDDQDYIRLELTGWKNNITITTTGPDEWSDTELYLYNDSQGQLAYNDQDEVLGNSYSRIEMTDLPAGSYYIMARGYGSWSTIGSYFVDVNVQVSAPPSGTPDAFESDDTIAEVTDSAIHLLDTDATQAHSIHQDGDVDFARIEITSTSDITIRASVESSGLFVTLFDVDGTEVATSKGREDSYQLSQTNLVSGTYFVSMRNEAIPQFIAAYDLSLTVYVHPEIPSNLQVVAGEDSLSLTWDAVTPSTSYIVQYSYSAAGPFETVEATQGSSPLSAPENNYTLNGLPSDARTFICVRAVNGTAQSECSEVISATPLAASGD
ncbi:MAG: hypothetical protein HOK97_02265, partial [Deltaproteobacteria bacterium]|nr:hypothetical protein [Deltaproteobacteria bacterium]